MGLCSAKLSGREFVVGCTEVASEAITWTGRYMQIWKARKIIEFADLPLTPAGFDFFSNVRQQGSHVVAKNKDVSASTRDAELLTSMAENIDRVCRVFFEEVF